MEENARFKVVLSKEARLFLKGLSSKISDFTAMEKGQESKQKRKTPLTTIAIIQMIIATGLQNCSWCCPAHR